MHHHHLSSNRIGRAPMRLALSFFMLLLAALVPSQSFAHGGEDHGDAKPTVIAGVGPRMTAQSEAFEIVAIPTAKDGGRLRIYLGDLPSNAPIAKALGDEINSKKYLEVSKKINPHVSILKQN